MSSHGPAEHPMRPPKGKDWLLPIEIIEANTTLFRICNVKHPDSAFFGRLATYRFDAPDKSFGVCYLGTTLDTCFRETLKIERSKDNRHVFIRREELSQRYAAFVRVIHPLLLANLANEGLTQLGIDVEVTGGYNYPLSRDWAKAIHNHSMNVDGILYSTRHHNNLYSIALFERCKKNVEFENWGNLGDPNIHDLWVEVLRIIKRFGLELLG